MQTAESRPEIVVPLAAALFKSEAEALNFEHQIEEDLNRIFEEQWGPGWDYDPHEQSIDVFLASATPERAAALMELGFSIVRIHAHGTAVSECSCATHWGRQ